MAPVVIPQKPTSAGKKAELGDRQVFSNDKTPSVQKDTLPDCHLVKESIRLMEGDWSLPSEPGVSATSMVTVLLDRYFDCPKAQYSITYGFDYKPEFTIQEGKLVIIGAAYFDRIEHTLPKQ